MKAKNKLQGGCFSCVVVMNAAASTATAAGGLYFSFSAAAAAATAVKLRLPAADAAAKFLR